MQTHKPQESTHSKQIAEIANNYAVHYKADGTIYLMVKVKGKEVPFESWLTQALQTAERRGEEK